MRLRKLSVILLTFVLLFGLMGVTGAQDDDVLQITLIINGLLGDQSFFDSAQRGADMIMDDFEVDVNTVELGYDPSNWESGFDDVVSDTDSYDAIMVGTFDMMRYVATRAHLYPDKIFILYDVSVPYEGDPDNADACVDGCTNVYSISYAQNEGSFLAGVYAAAITSSDLEGINDAAVIGVIGGQEIPVIDDFIVGFEQGACLVNPDIQVIRQYVGGWDDPARGKEIALAMFEQDADIVFQVAGGSGVGVFEAALEQGHYAIGVDSDQASILLNSDPDQAERILTSMLKNVDLSFYRAIELWSEDEMPLGEGEVLGIAEEGVGLAVNEIYDAATPDDVKAIIEAAQEAVINGDIEVVSVFSEDPASAGMGCDAMPEMMLDMDM